MAKVFANDHNATLAANDLALIADLLNARLHLHLYCSFVSFSFYLSLQVIFTILLVAVNDSTFG